MNTKPDAVAKPQPNQKSLMDQAYSLVFALKETWPAVSDSGDAETRRMCSAQMRIYGDFAPEQPTFNAEGNAHLYTALLRAWSVYRTHPAARLLNDGPGEKCEKALFAHAELMSQADYLKLQGELESLELANAAGQDTPEGDRWIDRIDALMCEAPWTLHPDEGCIPMALA